MSPVGALLLAIYGGAALFVTLYAVAQVDLLRRWWAHREPVAPGPLPEPRPRVTVQLPLYNEEAVARRLLRNIAALDWPRDRLQVQVLDDSTDGTVAIVRDEVARLRAQGLDIVHVRRPSREGFKAGALAHGLETATGELVAIFDADFLPRPDFLVQAVSRMGPEHGLVQCRWSFLNADASLLARVQAFHLDLHFALEQHARCHGGLLMGFNGTAGVWRRACIDAAGGWEGDTLTEDLDLSFRAQLAGWPLQFVDVVDAPSELPLHMSAIRSQQHRWMKGGAQVAAKLLPTLWRSDRPLAAKLQGTAHLLGSSIFVAVLVLCTCLPLVPPLRVADPIFAEALLLPSVGLVFSLFMLVAVYTAGCARRAGGRLGAGLRRALGTLPLLLAFCNGLSLHNSRAVLQGWFGGTGTFVRTPKAGDAGGLVGWAASWEPTWLGEAAMLAWSLVGVVWALSVGDPVGVGFLSLQTLGFAAVLGVSLSHAARLSASPAPALLEGED
ncbi:MAG: glycosyltransferase [Alphaproteobacteria bacterium]|nr:glycosyltransferase [Alphaproteobacteria bacterium]MCB9797256.1 glycosyltransferase [Alphaproteobacteria bacterium]